MPKMLIMTAKESAELRRKANDRAAFSSIMESRGQYMQKPHRNLRRYDRKRDKREARRHGGW